MKKPNENIDYYFAIARQAPIVVSIDQVKDMLAKGAIGLHVKPVKTSINSKYIIMSSIAVVTTAAVVISINLSDKEKNSTRNSTILPVQTKVAPVTKKPLQTNKNVSYPLTNTKTLSVDNNKNMNITPIVNDIKEDNVFQQAGVIIEKKDSVKKLNYCCKQNKLQNSKLQYDQIDIFGIYKDIWARVRNDNKYGFIDTSGREVVPVVYDRIDLFNLYKNDFALVKQDGKYGFIDITGKEVVVPMYDKIELYGMYHENWALVKNDGYYGFIDEIGKEVVKTIYNKIYLFGMYRSNWAMVKSDKRFGFIDISGKEVVTPTYDKINFFDEYHSDWALVERDKLLGFIDVNGKEVVVPQYDEIDFYGMIKDGWARVKKDGQYMFIDNIGKEVEQ